MPRVLPGGPATPAIVKDSQPLYIIHEINLHPRLGTQGVENLKCVQGGAVVAHLNVVTAIREQIDLETIKRARDRRLAKGAEPCYLFKGWHLRNRAVQEAESTPATPTANVDLKGDSPVPQGRLRWCKLHHGPANDRLTIVVPWCELEDAAIDRCVATQMQCGRRGAKVGLQSNV